MSVKKINETGAVNEFIEWGSLNLKNMAQYMLWSKITMMWAIKKLGPPKPLHGIKSINLQR